MDGLYESKSEKKTKRCLGNKITKADFGVIDINKARKADKYFSQYEEDYMRRPGYLDKQVKAYRKDRDEHKKALAGRPDNGRYSSKTNQDIKDYHYRQIKDAAYDDYQKGRKKYVEETVNPKKRFKFGRLK